MFNPSTKFENPTTNPLSSLFYVRLGHVSSSSEPAIIFRIPDPICVITFIIVIRKSVAEITEFSVVGVTER